MDKRCTNEQGVNVDNSGRMQAFPACRSGHGTPYSSPHASNYMLDISLVQLRDGHYLSFIEST